MHRFALRCCRLTVSVLFAFSSLILVEPLVGQDKAAGQETNNPADETGMQSTEVSIQQFLNRVNSNPADYGSWIVLGRLYMRQAKEDDDVASYRKAEDAFRKAHELQPENHAALTNLAFALHAQHKFSDALDVATRSETLKPGDLAALSAIGDAKLELGKCVEAQEIFERLAEAAPVASVIVRQAHVAELLGKTDAAIELAQKAQQKAIEMGSDSGQLAWYCFRIGVMYFRDGQFENATESFSECLARETGNSQALAYLARIQAADGNLDEAISLTRQALASSSEAPIEALLGDLLVADGQTDAAEKHFSAAEKAMEDEATVLEFAHLRERALFLLNHDRELPLALELAEKDLTVRQDVFTWDTLAWALYKNGRFQEAWDAMEKALEFGTRNAEIYYHAGLVKNQLGDRKEAISLLERSREISPFFCPLQSSELDRVLTELKSRRDNE